MSARTQSWLRRRPRRLSVESLEPRLPLSANPLQVTPVAAMHVTEGRHFEGSVATFTDSDNNRQDGKYRAEINWGDGSTSQGEVERRANHFEVRGQHTYIRSGSDQITVSVQDADGDTGTDAVFVQTNLVSDGAVTAPHIDPNLVNPWGIAFNPTGPFWISDNGQGVSTLYDSNGTPQSLIVSIPGGGGAGSGAPTGAVYNATSDFAIADGPARFLFATEDGTIAAWNPGSDPSHPQTTAALVVDDSSAASPPIFKGIALGQVGANNYLYATDFHNGAVDVFDKNFHPVTLAGSFTDAKLPSGFAPFGIQNIGGQLYVTFAMQDADRHDDVHGPGLGYVDVFNTNGTLARRFASQGPLNAPWGLARAPSNFGAFSNDILVGNFGDGRIDAYNPTTGKFLGRLSDGTQTPISIDGLWGLAFGNGARAGATDELFFTAGLNDEADGLFGKLNFDKTSGTTATVAEAPLFGIPLLVQAQVNSPFSGRVGLFLDANRFEIPSHFQARIDWGDNTAASDGTVSKQSGLFAVASQHTYTQPGRFKLTMTILDDDGPPLTIVSWVMVRARSAR